MLLPLLVVMLVGIGSLLLHPEHIDTRSSLPIGALLTAVFLQQSYSDALPDTGYMVLMDKIYLLSYALISLVLLQIIRTGNLTAKGGGGMKAVTGSSSASDARIGVNSGSRWVACLSCPARSPLLLTLKPSPP